jgi:DNA-binding CsgD family transcriptional regulator
VNSPDPFEAAILSHDLGRDMRDMLEHAHLDHLLPGVLSILTPAVDLTRRSPVATAAVPITVVLQLLQLCGPLVLRAVLTVAAPHLRIPAATEDRGGTPVTPVVVGPPRLSEREQQVLEGMASGMSNGQIGRSIYVSEDTVKTHARRLFHKIGAKDRAHAVYLGCRLGLLGGDDDTAAGAA